MLILIVDDVFCFFVFFLAGYWIFFIAQFSVFVRQNCMNTHVRHGEKKEHLFKKCGPDSFVQVKRVVKE